MRIFFAGVRILTVLVLAGGGVALADGDAERARQHYRKGLQYYDLGHFEEAIREFEAAYKVKEDPALLYNLAQACRRAGQLRRAVDLYRTYLRRAPEAANRDEVEKRIAALEKQMAEQPGAPAPAPPAVAVAPAPAASPEPAAPPAGPPALPAAPAPDTGPALRLSAADAGPDEGRGLRVTGILVASVGAALVATGAMFSLQANALDASVTRAQQFDPTDDRAGRRAAALQWVGYGVGGAAVAGGVALYLLSRGAPQPVAPAIGPRGAAVTLAFRY